MGEKISGLPPASALDGTELMEIVQNGISKRTTTGNTSNLAGIDDVLAVDQGLTADRNLYTGAGNFRLSIGDNVGGRTQLDISPAVSTIEISTSNQDATDNRAWMSVHSSDSQSDFMIYGFVDDEAKVARIAGSATVSTATIEYTADTHEFDGNVGIGITPVNLFDVSDGSNTLLSIQPTVFHSNISANDGIAQSQLLLYADLDGDIVNFSLATNDGVNSVFITGNAQTDAINYNAGLHLITGSISLLVAGNKLNIATGSNASIGTATLVAGTVVVATTAVTTNSKIFLSVNTPGGTTGVNYAAPSASIINATSFVINSSSTAGAVVITDISSINWWIVN